MEWDKALAWITFAVIVVGGFYYFWVMISEYFFIKPAVAEDAHLLCSSCGKYKEYVQAQAKLCLGCVERAERDKDTSPVRVPLPAPPRYVTTARTHIISH